MNLYAFVGNNPVNWVDPFGLYRSHWLLRALVPGQVAWDRAITAVEHGDPLGAGLNAMAMIAEQVLVVLTWGEASALVQASATVLPTTADVVCETTLPVPASAKSLGEWGETLLAQVLGNAGDPHVYFRTSLGGRYIDRLVNGIAHEAKAGINVSLTSSIQNQIRKDAELIARGRIQGAHWHFFQGVEQAVLDFLTQHGISYTVH
jgi:hypothetical protein